MKLKRCPFFCMGLLCGAMLLALLVVARVISGSDSYDSRSAARKSNPRLALALSSIRRVRADEVLEVDTTAFCVLRPYFQIDDVGALEDFQTESIDLLREDFSHDLQWLLVEFVQSRLTHVTTISEVDVGRLISRSQCFDRRKFVEFDIRPRESAEDPSLRDIGVRSR